MMTREAYLRLSIIEKLTFWETLEQGAFFDESWTPVSTWDNWVSEVCREAREHILGQSIASLVKTIEGEYVDLIGKSTGTFLSVTGEYYVEIVSCTPFDAARDTNGGLGPGSAKLRGPHDTPQEAIAAALANFKRYADWWASANPPDCVPKLYWRISPEIDMFEGKWKVYMRCLLSAKPPLDDQSLSLLLSKRSSSSMSVSSP